MKSVQSLVSNLSLLGQDARARVVKKAVAALKPEELEQLAAEFEAQEKQQVAELVKAIHSVLTDSSTDPANVTLALEEPPTDDGDPMTHIRCAAILAARCAAAKKGNAT